MQEEIKDIILSYCEGFNHLVFSPEDLDEMVDKINQLCAQGTSVK